MSSALIAVAKLLYKTPQENAVKTDKIKVAVNIAVTDQWTVASSFLCNVEDDAVEIRAALNMLHEYIFETGK